MTVTTPTLLVEATIMRTAGPLFTLRREGVAVVGVAVGGAEEGFEVSWSEGAIRDKTKQSVTLWH